MANSKPEKSSFAGRLRELMSEAGYIPRTLAQKLGVDEGVVSRWCSGRNKPRADNVWAILDVLGCEFGYLVKGYGPKWQAGREPRETPKNPDKRRRENREAPIPEPAATEVPETAKKSARTQSGSHDIRTIRSTTMKMASSGPPPPRSQK